MTKNNSKKAFTIVELIVVIAVIGILAGIVIVGYGAWRTSVTVTQVKNDLNAAAQAMESARTFNNAYPTTLPSFTTSSSHITLTLASNTAATSYCIDGVSSDSPTKTFYIAFETKNQGPLAGTCATRSTIPAPGVPTGLAINTASSTTISLMWMASSDASSYTAQCATDALFMAGTNSSTVAAPAVTTVVTGLTHNTIYYCRVNATNAISTSSWSVSLGPVSNAVVTTLAGSITSGSANGTGSAASFNFPQGIAVDSSGTVYVSDTNNHLIRKITSSGAVTTLAGSGTSGSANGTGSNASFYYPAGVDVDSSGTVYVADEYNHLIRKITSSGAVTTLAGGTQGSANGTGSAAQFNYPQDVAVDSSGTVYVADTYNQRIRKITSSGAVTTLAGSSTSGSANGTGSAAQFNYPQGIAVDSSGTVYVADTNNHLIRKITSSGAVTTLAGSGTSGSANGTGSNASFYSPTDVAVDSFGTVYVADQKNNVIRMITSSGAVTTLAGRTQGSANGIGSSAQFYSPQALDVDSSGTVYVADTFNYLIRKLQ